MGMNGIWSQMSIFAMGCPADSWERSMIRIERYSLHGNKGGIYPVDNSGGEFFWEFMGKLAATLDILYIVICAINLTNYSKI